ncbi:MAG: caspase family protein [bacterium]|nr:caspase family protein [bacterium]
MLKIRRKRLIIIKPLPLFVFLCVVFSIVLFAEKPLPAKKKLTAIHRFAMVVGANNGGYSRERLRYAVSDANSVMNVLHDMGGVHRKDGLLLFDPDRRNFFSAARKIRRKIAGAKSQSVKAELVFYYSGHSDEEGILLGNEKIFYKEIKKFIDAVPADVKIAILDSCSSGAFTRIKGGKRRAPFLVDSSYDMKGYAFMSSSSSDEASQESDRIKGSFFTYYLLSGLRGAADVTQDGRITLNEAYQYAYNETLTRTEKTMSGPQHPNYNIQMTGTGDVILTNVRESSAGLVVHRNIHGKLFIHDSDNVLIAELHKAYGRNMELALEHGKYRIVNKKGRNVYEAGITLQKGKRSLLAYNNFKKINRESTVARGDTPVNKDEKEDEEKKEKERKVLMDMVDKDKYSFNWYGALIPRYGRLGGENTFLLGTRGGLILNHSFVFGAGGFGNTTSRRLTVDSTDRDVSIGYGGFMFEYYFFATSLVNISTGVIIGAGGVGYKVGSGDDQVEGSAFFALEPHVGVYLNVTDFLRVGVDVSYLYINGISMSGVSDSDYRGFSASLVVAYVSF